VADQIGGEALASQSRRRSEAFKCCYCGDVELSTRIATFSYRKALDFPMFHHSWLLAERKLRNSGRWVFIGYSLPSADFEFKYLLKRVELACRPRPEIIVVTGGDDESAIQRTMENYRGLFGNTVSKEEETFFDEGLTDRIVSRITS
jgi:hypothetical protein